MYLNTSINDYMNDHCLAHFVLHSLLHRHVLYPFIFNLKHIDMA